MWKYRVNNDLDDRSTMSRAHLSVLFISRAGTRSDVVTGRQIHARGRQQESPAQNRKK